MQRRGAGKAGAGLQLLCVLLSLPRPTALPQSAARAPEDKTSDVANVTRLDSQLQLGRLHARRGDLAGAQTIFSALVAEYPASAEAHYNLGLALVGQSGSQGSAMHAQQELRRALQLRDTFPEAENVLGMLLFDNGDPDAALSYLRKAATEEDTSAEIHFHLGRVLSQRDDTDSEAQYRRAILLRPEYPEAQTALGEVLLRTGRASEAKLHFEKALRANPDLEGAHYGIARVLQSSGEAQAAALEFAQAKVLIERRSDAVMSTHVSNSALDLARQGHKEDAVAEARRAIVLSPDNGVAIFNLGLLLADTGDLSAALHEVRKAALLLPVNYSVQATLLKLQQAKRQEDAQAGITATETPASPPAAPPLYGDRQADDTKDGPRFARRLAQEHDFLGASGQLLYELRQQPTRTDLRLELIFAWLQLKRWQEAEFEARKVIFASTAEWRAHLYLAEALMQEGKGQEAKAELRAVLQLDPKNSKSTLILQQIADQSLTSHK